MVCNMLFTYDEITELRNKEGMINTIYMIDVLGVYVQQQTWGQVLHMWVLVHVFGT